MLRSWVFLTEILNAPLLSPTPATFPAPLILLDHPDNIQWTLQIMKIIM